MAYRVNLLAPFGSQTSTAQGISENGTVVGASGTGSYSYRAGQYATLPNDTDYANPFGINDAGYFVGSESSARYTSGFLYDGSFHIYGYGFTGTILADINNSGIAVGSSNTTGTNTGILIANGVKTDFFVPGSISTTIAGISDEGYIVGSYNTQTPPGSFNYISDGSAITTIGTPSGASVVADDLNDDKTVVGSYYDAAGEHGFVWSGGQFSLLDIAGAKSTSLTGINNTGKIVGTYIDQNNTSHGFVGDHFNEVFRFYDTVTSDHFYTTSATEAAAIKASLPTFTYEGTPWLTPDKSAVTVDVFRFYDTVTKTHFLTQDPNEAATIKSTLPTFTYEGVAFQAYASPGAADTYALGRFYNTNTKVHTYAADASEIALIKSGAVGQGWNDEDASFVVHASTGNLILT